MEICRLIRILSEPVGDRRIRWPMIWLALLLFAGCVESLPVSAIAGNPADRIIWADASVPTLHISSPSGIGSARLLAPNSDWPRAIDVSLDLTALEGFTVSSGAEVYRLELTAERRVLLEPAESVLELRHLPSASDTAGITVRINPTGFAEPVSELTVEWVDYYR